MVQLMFYGFNVMRVKLKQDTFDLGLLLTFLRFLIFRNSTIMNIITNMWWEEIPEFQQSIPR